MPSSQRAYSTLIVFLIVVAGVAAFGAYFQPGDWYAELSKPPWTPPNWLFGPVWALLYVCIAIAGWLIFAEAEQALMKFLWTGQLVLNGIWSWLFFGLHRTGLALLDILALLVCILLLLWAGHRSLPAILWLLLPYSLWVGYASSLNAAIHLAN